MSIRAGFIGLGNIGKPMARRLVEAGLETTVFDLRDQPVRELAALGARAARSAREVARHAEVIGVCVRDDADVRAAALGPDGILEGASAGAVIALHSTIQPSTVHEVMRAASEQSVGVVDAPITGGALGAEKGTLCYMMGGQKEWVDLCRPVFETSAAKIVHTGECGSGAATKLCNNLMTYLGFLAAVESTLLAQSASLSREALEEVTGFNGNLTGQMRALLGLRDAIPQHTDDEGFQAMLRSFANLAEKDLGATLAFARERGVDLPGTALCRRQIGRVYGVEEGARK
jgi:3-hydroxyisobutyrate dehydrogenase-like beta-hydroxyacid dehydrogenase